MKRFLALSLCAVALAASLSHSASAGVDISLNIEYFDPFNPSSGGNWTLVAKTDTPGTQGIIALTVRLTNIGLSDPASVHPLIGHDINGGIIKTGIFAGATEYVYGQNAGIGVPPLVLGVGLPGGPSNLVSDPLGDNATWANSSVIATGTIANLSALPSFTLAAANESLGGSIIVAASIDLLVVRTLAIPEPTTLLLGVCAAARLVLRRRR